MTKNQGQRLNRRAALRASGLGTVGLAGLYALACGGSTTSTSQGTATSGGASAGTGGAAAPAALSNATLTAAIEKDINSPDVDSLAGSVPINWPSRTTLFDGAGVVQTAPKTGEILPNVATSWELSEDKLTYTYKMRPDVVFHNGEKMTAEDVAFSMDRARGQTAYNKGFEAGTAGALANVAAARAIDPLTFSITLKQPDVAWERTSWYIFPRKLMETNGDAAWEKSPVAAGAFKWVSRAPDTELVMERHDGFFRKPGEAGGEHVPYIKRLVQKVIPEGQARIAALKAGEVDMISGVRFDNAKALQADKSVNVYLMSSGQPLIIQFNTTYENVPGTSRPNPFRDVRVRQAAVQAVDVDGIIRNVMSGFGKRHLGTNPAGFGNPDNQEALFWKYDPAKAKQLLTAAGFPNGFDAGDIIVPIARWTGAEDVTQAVAQMMTDAGIRTKAKPVEYAVARTGMADRSNYPMIVWGGGAWGDVGQDFPYQWVKTANFSVVAPDPARDAKIAIAQAEFDPGKRKPLLQAIVKENYENAYWLNLYTSVNVVVLANKKWAWTPYNDGKEFPEYWAVRPQ